LEKLCQKTATSIAEKALFGFEIAANHVRNLIEGAFFELHIFDALLLSYRTVKRVGREMEAFVAPEAARRHPCL